MKNYPDKEHAIVIGSGMGGMVCACVLSEHFSKVTIIEKDTLPEYPATRKSVPQGHFLHILLAKGVRLLNNLFPELFASLESDGAVKFNVGQDIAAKMSHGWIPRYKSDIWLYGCSRPLLEWHIHKQLIKNSKIHIMEKSEVQSLLYDHDRNCVTGVTINDKDTKKNLYSDIVVDSGGRTSKSIKWLEALGFDKPEETIIQPPVVYSCRAFKKPANFESDWKLLAVYPDDVVSSSGGFVNPIENDQWMVTLWGVGKNLSRDESHFLEFSRSLSSADIYDAIKDAEPISSVYTRRKTVSRINHFEKLTRRPENFFLIGDAVCCYNPVYGQGMTSAILGAVTLGEMFSSYPKDSTNLADKFHKKLAEVNTQIWQRGTMDDLRWSDSLTENKALKNEIEVRTKFMERIWSLAVYDTQIAELVWSVMHFLKPVNELMTLEVQNKLAKYEKEKAHPKIWHARVGTNSASKNNKLKITLEHMLGDHVTQDRLNDLAKHWVAGGSIDWQNFHQDKPPQRLHLPTYPFEKVKFCISKNQGLKSLLTQDERSSKIHPLVHENTSDFFEQRFTSFFSGTEFFLKGHHVNTEKVFPSSALLEMPRASIEKLYGKHINDQSIQLRDVTWPKVITMKDVPIEIKIRLSAEVNNLVQYEVYSETENTDQHDICCRGVAHIIGREVGLSIGIDEIRSQMNKGKISSEKFYKDLKKMGVEYGAGYQGITELMFGENQVFTQIKLPNSILDTQYDYVLHPCVIDSALQSAVYMMLTSRVKGLDEDIDISLNESQPFSLDQLDIITSCKPLMYCWTRLSASKGHSKQAHMKKLDIDLYDDKGNICIKIIGIQYKTKNQKITETEDKNPISEPLLLSSQEQDDRSILEKIVLFLKHEISDQLTISANDIDTTRGYFELGLDSLGFLMLIEKIQNVIEEKLPPEKLFEYVTIDQLSCYLYDKYEDKFKQWSPIETVLGTSRESDSLPEKQQKIEEDTQPLKNPLSSLKNNDTISDNKFTIKSTSDVEKKSTTSTTSKDMRNFPELIHLNKSNQGRPVFWIHGGIGGVQPYYYIAEGLQRPFYGIQAKGKIRTSTSSMKSVAEYYIKIIKSIQSQGPYDLGGYSLGGLICYEITRQLQRNGDKVSSIVMLDTLDTSGLEKVRSSVKSQQLLYVNLTLASRVMQDPSKFSQALIHHNELNESLEPKEFKEQLLDIAEKKGLISKKLLKEKVEEMAGEEEAYNVDHYSISPLRYPGEVRCYYFRNKSGLFFGELEPYFSISSDKSKVDKTNYWHEWQENLHDFHIMDVDTPNHMNFLLEAKVYKIITDFCHNLYSKKGITDNNLNLFKNNLKETHGVLKYAHDDHLKSGFIFRLLSNITRRKKKAEVDPA